MAASRQGKPLHEPPISEYPAQDPTLIAGAVDDALATGFRWLHFSSLLESLFERETGAARVRQMIGSGLIAILTYDLFIITDAIIAPLLLRRALLVRFGIITPLTILVMIAQYRGLSPFLREGSGATATVIGAIGAIYLYIHSQDPNGPYFVYGLILITLFGNMVLRLRFYYAMAASFAILVSFIAGMVVATNVAPTVFGTNVMVLFSTALLTLYTSYTLERDHRLNYLLGLRERMRQTVLTAHNLRLTELAHIDPLTGIANRREFDDYLGQLRQGPRPETLAIVMFDIDHFKQYNDLYGHPAGDECLRRIAGALHASLRRSSDLAARFGGEEFVVVLPGTTGQMAAHAAERMRQAVIELAIPHAGSPVAKVVTISGGVAAMDVDEDVETILRAADAALYQAKSAGRNRIQEYLLAEK